MTAAEPLQNVAAQAHRDYFDQIFQSPPAVCGRQLKPLSIGRYRLMSWLNVAFVAEDERAATAGDLLIGVLICSMSVEDFQAFASQPDFKAQIRKWGRRCGFFEPSCLNWPIIGSLLRRAFGNFWAELDYDELNRETSVFNEYIRNSSKSPDHWAKNNDGRASAAHWSQGIEVSLRGELNWSEREINEAPLGKALHDFFKLMESHGLVELMTAEEALQMNTPLTAEEAKEADESARKLMEYLNSKKA